jgi:DNA-binding NarL/FixJ family response regulator
MNEQPVIYLVNDNEDDKMLLREALYATNQQAIVMQASDCQDLLQLLESQSFAAPKVIVLDFNIAKLNGLETVKLLKSHPTYKTIPLLVFSTGTDPQTVKAAYSCGVCGFISRSYSYSEFIHIAKALHLCFFESYQVQS